MKLFLLLVSVLFSLGACNGPQIMTAVKEIDVGGGARAVFVAGERNNLIGHNQSHFGGMMILADGTSCPLPGQTHINDGLIKTWGARVVDGALGQALRRPNRIGVNAGNSNSDVEVENTSNSESNAESWVNP